MHFAREALVLFDQRAHEILRQNLREAGDVKNEFLRIQRGELSACFLQRIHHLRRYLAHAGIKQGEQPRGAAANDRDIAEFVNHPLTFAPSALLYNAGPNTSSLTPSGHSMDNQNTVEYKGAFRLVNKVAEGGMATVYEAEQLGPEGFTKRIALKVIHPHYAKRTEFLRLFIDEAKLSANLMHGNVVQIYQLGEVQGEYFIALEFIQGPTLRNVIDRHYELGTPIPATLAAYICSRVSRALDFAHNFVSPSGQRLDIVHRDVSPGNVMITWDGHIKLADFGIAKARTSFDPAIEQKMRIGKKHYMSPEQVLGSAVDGKSDVFSLGVVLYELLALSPLFREEETSLLVDEVAVQPLPNLRARITNLDKSLEDILLMALQRSPTRRATAAQLAAALDSWITEQGEFASPDKLQAHLSELFPASYQPRTRTNEETSFGNLREALKPSRQSKSILERLFG